MSLLRRRPPASIGELLETPRVGSLEFYALLNWIDDQPLLDRMEAYRRRLHSKVLDTLEPDGRPRYNLLVDGRAKKNFKTSDEILAALFRLAANDFPKGNQCYLFAADEGQAADGLTLAKLLVAANPLLAERLIVRKNVIERRDGHGFLMILPAQDVAGSHGKTFCFCGFDEIHTQRNWDLLEAMQPDPTRPEALTWITSYASLFHRPGVPLHDLCAQGRAGTDPRMAFSWYAADFTTDPDFQAADPETRANPSRSSWEDPNYLAQQQRRLPAHKYRRLHLNLPGLPEGSAFQVEPVTDTIARGITSRRPEPGLVCKAVVDMSGGSSDDAVLAIGHKDQDGRAVLDVIMNQGQPPPFDPRAAVARFAAVLRERGVPTVHGDAYAGETFRQDFAKHDIGYQVLEQTRSQLYEALEPRLNAREVVLLDVPILEQQLLGLVWRGGKIDHPVGEHDDWANAAAGLVSVLLGDEFIGPWFLREDRAVQVPSPEPDAMPAPPLSVERIVTQGEIAAELQRQAKEDQAAAPAVRRLTPDERRMWRAPTGEAGWSVWGGG